MNISLQGTNLELNDNLRAFIDEKMRDAFRAFGDMDLEAVAIDLELELTTHHHRKDQQLYRAEANIIVPGRKIRAEASDENMYTAITQLKRRVTRDIRKWRERLITEKRDGNRRRHALLDAEPETLDIADPVEETLERWDEEVAVEEAVVAETVEEWDDADEDERDNV